MYDSAVETRSLDEQFALDQVTYRRQLGYLFERSTFYQRKFARLGLSCPADAGGLESLAQLPFTEKDELRATQASAPPFGDHLACDPADLRRIYSTSGTTGVPCYLGLTRRDTDRYATHLARGYTAAGFSPGQRVVIAFNAGPFIAGESFYGFNQLGLCLIPVGTGNTERLVSAVDRLGATGISCTPSHALYLLDWCQDRGIDTRALGLKKMIVAGEPGGGDLVIRNKLEQGFGCDVRESMGIGDISLSTWAEDAAGGGMNFMARGAVHVELVEPSTGEPLAWKDGAEGELVYTALAREAMPLLRFRSRDHVVVNTSPNPTGRTGPRIRCIGRTDDMLIVRGVNLFPSAIRGVLKEFTPSVSGLFQVKPKTSGVRQAQPLPLFVELGRHSSGPNPLLAHKIQSAIREHLLVATVVEMVPYGAVPRGTYKTRLVEHPLEG